MNKVLEYIKYRWKSKGRHGIHSPFVYDFMDKCQTYEIDERALNTLKRYSEALISNSQEIEVTDLGAGSKRMGTKRAINKIAQNSSSKGKYGKLLYRISHFYKPAQILELGTSVGIGSVHLHLGNPTSHLVTVEGCPQTHAVARQQMDNFNLQNIELINSDFQSYLENENRVFDLIYLDGHHVGEAVLTYVKALQKNMHDETILIVDDIYWSDSMYTAWLTLQEMDQFHCSIDLYRMGILVSRTHQQKEHFQLKTYR